MHEIFGAVHRAIIHPMWCAGICLGLVACGGAPTPPATEGQWVAEIGLDHPLTDRIWDTHAHAFIDRETLLARAEGADYVLIGERHDHPDHHRLQGWIVEALLEGGRHASVAFEMLDADDAGTLGGLPPKLTPEAFAEQVHWAESGWPDFALYRPIFSAVFSRSKPVQLLAGNPARTQLKAVMMQGYDTLPEGVTETLALDRPLESEAAKSLEAEIVAAHCGHASGGLIPAMARGQRLKDATMAEALINAHEAGGAILITGNGHARTDRGVPWYVRARAGGKSVSIGLIQVTEGALDPDEATSMPFDYVWFTPRLDDIDPCERFKARLEKLKAAHGGKLPPAKPLPKSPSTTEHSGSQPHSQPQAAPDR
ncbi:MAG: ChaN family lipoprotein [Bradymonadia bacterium]